MIHSNNSISQYFKKDFIQIATPCFFQKGQVICKEDDYDQTLFLIKSGTLNVSCLKENLTINIGTLSPNDLFGEVNYVFGGQRIATVTALEDTEIYQIKKEYNPAVSAKKGLYNYLQNLAVSRWIDTKLLIHPIFNSLPISIVKEIIQQKEHKILAAGNNIFKQGTLITRLWVNLSGLIEMVSLQNHHLEIFDAKNITPKESINNQASQWKAHAISECMIASFDLQYIKSIANDYPLFKDSLEKTMICPSSL